MTEYTRLNKYLSTHGYCSRREADRLIEQGRVFVNDEPATLGTKVSHKDDVRVEGRDRKREPKKIYILLNKPVGYITTADRRKKDNVMDLVDIEEQVLPIGRLDTQSCGLVLFTNDDVLSSKLSHPRRMHEKEYVVVVDKPIGKKDIGAMQSGVELDNGRTPATKVRQMSENMFAIILNEGGPQQIRKMCDVLGYIIISIKCTRIGPVKIISSYPEGLWRYLTEKETRDLKKMLDMDPGKTKDPKKKRRKR